ncbi:unnamed protein product [Rhizopus stolonifer]
MVAIPILPHEIRNTFIRPDSIRLYVPKQLDADSDEEKEDELELEKAKLKYKNKRLQKVVKKARNSIGKIRFTVIWEDDDEEESLYSEYLHDHPDWYLVEEFEHRTSQKLKNSAIEQSELGGGMDFE